MAKLADVLVYEWQAWKGFLISHLIADYCQVTADYQHRPEDMAAFLSPNVKAVLWQINLSQQQAFPNRRTAIIDYLKTRNLLVLNETVDDITKSNLQRCLVDAGLPSVRANPDMPGDTLLMVKSNLNWGGEVETRLPKTVYDRLYSEQHQSITRFDQYYVLPRKDLPDKVWKDSSVVVETYIFNNEESFYRVYGFGESLVVVKAHSKQQIKKINGDPRDYNVLTTQAQLSREGGRLPPRLKQVLHRFCHRIPIDYFCLDVMHDGNEFYIVDLNTTPYSGVDEQTGSAVEHLREGGKQLLKQRCAA